MLFKCNQALWNESRYCAFLTQGRSGFREYAGKAEDVLHTVGSPAAVFLIAGSDSGLKAGRVPFSRLDGTDKVGFIHLSGLDAHFLSYYFNLFNSHVRSLN